MTHLSQVSTQQTGVLLLHKLRQRPMNNPGLRLVLNEEETDRWVRLSETAVYLPKTSACADRSKLQHRAAWFGRQGALASFCATINDVLDRAFHTALHTFEKVLSFLLLVLCC